MSVSRIPTYPPCVSIGCSFGCLRSPGRFQAPDVGTLAVIWPVEIWTLYAPVSSGGIESAKRTQSTPVHVLIRDRFDRLSAGLPVRSWSTITSPVML